MTAGRRPRRDCVLGILVGSKMGVDEGTEEAFRAVAWGRQLFGEVRLAGRLPFLTTK